MAKSIGISPQRYGPYETGRSIPDDVLASIEKSTPIDVRWLLTGQGEMFSAPEEANAIKETQAEYRASQKERKSDDVVRSLRDAVRLVEKGKVSVTITIAPVGKE